MPVIIDPDPKLQNNLMAFGFECGPGWRPLIDHLIADLNERFPDVEIYVTQVKEKFGSLRFYVASATEEAFNIIHVYEYFSNFICEECGALWAENKADHGWYRTLCQSCREKRNE
jgi:hypothetical protein